MFYRLGARSAYMPAFELFGAILKFFCPAGGRFAPMG